MKDNKIMDKKELDNDKNILLSLNDTEIFDVGGGWARINVAEDWVGLFSKIFNLKD